MDALRHSHLLGDLVHSLAPAAGRARRSSTALAGRLALIIRQHTDREARASARAGLELRRASWHHRLLLRSGHRALARAERSHRRALRDAERAVAAATAEADAGLAAEEARLASSSVPRELGRYGPFVLLDDRLRGPGWEVPLSAHVRAVLEPPGATAPGEPDLSLSGGSRPRRRQRRSLLVDAPPVAYAHECALEDTGADAFARLVNVAALNAGRFSATRTAAAAESERALAELRAAAAARIEEARARVAAIETDRGAIEETKRRLAKTALDTTEVDRRRTALEKLRASRRS